MKRVMKVAVIGAGNVGAMLASRIIDANLADVVLVDVVPGLAKGKALDISDGRPIFNSDARITGTEDDAEIKGAGIVVVTAGLSRKPGMSRDDLLQKNAAIVKDVSSRIKEYCSSSIIIVVTNPLDAMSYLAMKITGFPARRVMGMAGVLDSSRFINISSENGYTIDRDKIFIMGSHGDTMVAIDRTESLTAGSFKEISERTRKRGAEVIGCLKTSSAYFAPSAAIFGMVKTILKNEGKTMCVSAYLNGEYGEANIYMGVPVVLDSSGIRKIVEIDLTAEEKKAFKKSAQEIRESIKKI